MLKSDGNTEEGSLDLRLVGRLATCPSFPDSGTVPVSPYPPPPFLLSLSPLEEAAVFLDINELSIVGGGVVLQEKLLYQLRTRVVPLDHETEDLVLHA